MDKILSSLKKKLLGCDADNAFFLQYSSELYFIVKEYCKHLLKNYCTTNSVLGHDSKKKREDWNFTRLLEYIEKANPRGIIFKNYFCRRYSAISGGAYESYYST